MPALNANALMPVPHDVALGYRAVLDCLERGDQVLGRQVLPVDVVEVAVPVSATTGSDQAGPLRAPSARCRTLACTSASRTTPTEFVLVSAIGVVSRPDSRTTPARSSRHCRSACATLRRPAPGWVALCGRMTVTPVRTASPRITVRWPTERLAVGDGVQPARWQLPDHDAKVTRAHRLHPPPAGGLRGAAPPSPPLPTLAGWPVTASRKVVLSSAMSSVATSASTVAVRGTLRSRAISPNDSPGLLADPMPVDADRHLAVGDDVEAVAGIALTDRRAAVGVHRDHGGRQPLDGWRAQRREHGNRAAAPPPRPRHRGIVEPAHGGPGDGCRQQHGARRQHERAALPGQRDEQRRHD